MINIYFVIIQTLAIIAVIFFLISFHQKTREKILIIQVISLAIWSIHFILLSALTGAILMIGNIFVIIIFLFKKEEKSLKNLIIFFGSLFLLIMFTIFTWNNFYSIFPLLGSGFAITAKWQNRPKIIRIVSFPSCIFWVIYDLFVGAWGSVIAEIFIIISITVSIMKK